MIHIAKCEHWYFEYTNQIEWNIYYVFGIHIRGLLSMAQCESALNILVIDSGWTIKGVHIQCFNCSDATLSYPYILCSWKVQPIVKIIICLEVSHSIPNTHCFKIYRCSRSEFVFSLFLSFTSRTHKVYSRCLTKATNNTLGSHYEL